MTIILEAPELDERNQKALAIYEKHLKPILEPKHNGKGIAILPETGEYEIGKTPYLAGRVLRQRFPGGQVVQFKIGRLPDFAFTTRYLVGLLQSQTTRE